VNLAGVSPHTTNCPGVVSISDACGVEHDACTWLVELDYSLKTTVGKLDIRFTRDS